VDDLAWDWADASGIPVIIQNLPPGHHRVLVELADANHHPLTTVRRILGSKRRPTIAVDTSG
jgi:hypothetical protein